MADPVRYHCVHARFTVTARGSNPPSGSVGRCGICGVSLEQTTTGLCSECDKRAPRRSERPMIPVVPPEVIAKGHDYTAGWLSGYEAGRDAEERKA